MGGDNKNLVPLAARVHESKWSGVVARLTRFTVQHAMRVILKGDYGEVGLCRNKPPKPTMPAKEKLICPP
jgi:hypothetical protein